MDVALLVRLTDGGWRNLAAPQCLGDVLCPAHRDTGRVDLKQHFLHGTPAAAVTLNDGRLEGYTIKARRVQGHIAGRGGYVALIMTATVRLLPLAALIPRRLGQPLCLGFQWAMECLLYAAPYQFLDLTRDYFFVRLYIFLDMVFRLLSEWCVVTSFYQGLQTMSPFIPFFIYTVYSALPRLVGLLFVDISVKQNT